MISTVPIVGSYVTEANNWYPMSKSDLFWPILSPSSFLQTLTLFNNITLFPPLLPLILTAAKGLCHLNVNIQYITLISNIHTHWPDIWGQLTLQLIFIQIQTPFNLTGGKKIHPSYSKSLSIFLSHPLGTAENILICTHAHLLEQISSNPADMIQGELENRCSQTDLQKPLIALHCLTSLLSI